MRRLLTTWLACWPLFASAQPAGLAESPGPTQGANCSSFAIGPCPPRVPRPASVSAKPLAGSAASPAKAVESAPAPRDRDAGESEVDLFIANHGKPSREAARAMLEPTDENIAAMMRRLQRDQAIAAYVGQRMTELQQSDPTLATSPTSAVPVDLPSFTAVRLVLVTQPECSRCDRASQALQRLVSIYPTLDARIVVAGVREPRQIVHEMARTGVTLPTSPADEALLQRIRRAPPYLLVADVRRQREGLVVDVEDTERLRLAVLEFQRGGSPRHVAKPEKSSQSPKE